MDIYRSDLTGTDEVATRKVSLTRMVGPKGERVSSIIGWDIAPPVEGESYCVSLGQGRVLRTSPVKEIHKGEKTLLIKTVNSTYRIDYLE